MRGKTKSRTLSLAAGLLLAALTLGLKASAEPQWVPSPLSYRAAERGETCSVLRQLQVERRKIASENQGALEAQINKLKSQREALLACAKLKDLPMDRGDLTESSMAEFCGPQFAIWIHQGYQLEMFRQDLTQATKDLQWITTQLTSICPGPGQGSTPAKRAGRIPGGTAVLARKGGEESRRGSGDAGYGGIRRRQPELRMAWLRGNELPR